MIIDAHAHIFSRVHGLIAAGPTRGLGYGRVAIGSKHIQIMPPLCETTLHTPEMLLAHMDWAGVEKAVLLQGPFYGECNQYVLDAVRTHPHRLTGTAYFDPWDALARKTWTAIGSSSGLVGVKLECSEATGLCGIRPGARLDDVNIAWLWDELKRHGMTLTIDLGAVGSVSYQTEALRLIATRHPDLRIIVAHLAQPNPTVEADKGMWRLWEDQIDLGLLPNVYFDTASLPAYAANEGFPYPSAGRYLRMAIDHIGPSKVMWGTDVPGLLAYATYPQLVRAAQLHLEFLSPSDQAMVFGGNAARVYDHKVES